MQGEEECLSGQRLSKDHSWRIVVISWVLGPESLKKQKTKQKNKQSLHHHMLFGRVSKQFSSLIQKQTPAYSIGTSNGTGFFFLKIVLFASKPTRWVSTNRDKKKEKKRELHAHG